MHIPTNIQKHIETRQHLHPHNIVSKYLKKQQAIRVLQYSRFIFLRSQTPYYRLHYTAPTTVATTQADNDNSKDNKKYKPQQQQYVVSTTISNTKFVVGNILYVVIKSFQAFTTRMKCCNKSSYF